MKRSAAKDGAGAGGSNILRGGKNTYTSKAKLGNWVEEEFKPEINVDNFSEPKYLSTANQQNKDGVKVKTSMFGAGLKAPEPYNVDYNNVVFPDKTNQADKWESVTQSAHAAPGSRGATEFSTSFKLKGGITDPKQLEEYRAKWSQETDVMRGKRFATNNSITLNTGVEAKYRARTVRKMPGVPAVVERTRDKILERGGNHGLRGIRRSFKVMDDSGDKKMSFMEFKYGLKDYGLRELTDIDFEMIWKYFDRDESGFVSFDEFLRGLRGEMTQRRIDLIGEAYDKLDRTGDGRVTVEDLSGVYDTSMHPDVLTKKLTEEEVMIGFMGQWDTLEKDGVVTFDEFIEYYKDVSCSVDEDDYFELMIRNAWQLEGGQTFGTSYIPGGSAYA